MDSARRDVFLLVLIYIKGCDARGKTFASIDSTSLEKRVKRRRWMARRSRAKGKCSPWKEVWIAGEDGSRINKDFRSNCKKG